MGEPGGVHSKVPGRRFLPSKEAVHPVEESGVQALQCLLEDGIAGSSFKIESLKEKWVGLEAGHKSPIPKPRVKLESQQDEEDGKREVRRSSEGGGSVRYHIAKLDKFIKQELRVTRLG